MPAFLLELRDPPASLAVLVAAGFALFAAGLDPPVFGPSTPTVQTALREQPQLQQLLLLSIVVKGAFYLIGGALGDLFDRRRLLLLGLGGLVLGESLAGLAGVLGYQGPIFFSGRILAAASVGLIVPVALACIATAYNGIPRATAIGLAYGAYGGGAAIAQALLSAVIRDVGSGPSLILAAVAGAGSLYVARRKLWPAHVGAPVSSTAVAGLVLWAYGLLSITAGLLGVGGGPFDPARLLLLGSGIAALAVFAVVRRRAREAHAGAPEVSLRPIAVVLMAGVVIAFAQVAPLQQAPLFFQIAADWKPFLASLATIPLTIGLLAAGPISGMLLSRLTPRVLVAGGLAAVGLGDLLLALGGPSTPYLYFILPFVAIGIGFVIGTTIRTALIFASVPSRLPSVAAAMNQTSVLIGGQIGLVVITSLVAQVALDSYRRSLGSLDAASAATAVANFSELLRAIGTSAFGPLLADLTSADAATYGAAYAAGVSASFAVAGAVSLIAAMVAWVGLAGHQRVDSVWEHRDERVPSAAATATGETWPAT